MISYSTTAKLLDCNVESARALQRKGIIVPTRYGYTYNQLVLMRIILLIRNELHYRNFTFAEEFKDYQSIINVDDLLLFIDIDRFLLFHNRDKTLINDLLKPKDKEIFSSESDKEIIKLIWEYFNMRGNVKHVVIIPVDRVCAYIEQNAKNMGLSIDLINSKKISFDEEGILTSV